MNTNKSQRPLHIVHTEANGGRGGQPMRIVNEALGLAQRGHRTTILCPADVPLYTLASNAGLATMALPLGRKNPATLLKSWRWLHANAPQVDVINTHNSADSWLMALASLAIRNPPPLVRTRHASGAPRDNAATRWLMGTAHAHVVTTGEALRHQLVAIGVPLKHSSSVPSGVDTDRFIPGDRLAARQQLGLAPDAFWLGVVSHLRPNKGHEVLLQAMARLDIPQLHLAIVGEGTHREAIATRVAELGLTERVLFAGHQAAPQDWFPAFDIALSPSHDLEGLPQGVMQALACEVATIATDAGGTGDAIIDDVSGLLVPQRDPAALASAIERLYRDEALRQRLAVDGHRHLLAHFTRTHMLDSMERIFRDVAGRRAQR
ncbi:glycosyltransferase family 4 protein [Chitinolyticbacter albus]|uniref:glycosyltransferase family 4 protein n=1 Tax=Chitinolyticbacter albus TaxID=2961951 RepID=UPI00210DB2C0|nr:glycosyltransferase family 4 protein [Chitinolyticbacter albus]